MSDRKVGAATCPPEKWRRARSDNVWESGSGIISVAVAAVSCAFAVLKALIRSGSITTHPHAVR